MIFLKKIFAAAAAILCIGIQCGCGVYTDENDIQPVTSVEETTAATVQTPVLTAVEGTYVYDNAAVLSTEAVANCNAYTAALYKEKLSQLMTLAAKRPMSTHRKHIMSFMKARAVDFSCSSTMTQTMTIFSEQEAAVFM